MYKKIGNYFKSLVNVMHDKNLYNNQQDEAHLGRCTTIHTNHTIMIKEIVFVGQKVGLNHI